MKKLEVVAMGMASAVVARWIAKWGRHNAREMVLEHLSGIHGDIGPVFRAAYLTAFGK